MKVPKPNGRLWVGLVLIALPSCSRGPEGWTPILEQTSTSFLRTEAERVLTEVRQARSMIPSEPASALDSLTRAEHGLDHLLRYYLPLLDARERSYNAYRHFYLGETDQTMQELEQVEALLLGVSELDDGRLLDEMQDPLEKVEDARAALRVGSSQAVDDLEALATTLNFLVLKGELVLAGD